MHDQTVHIKFTNIQNPNAGFDIVNLSTVFTRKQVDHSPYEPHLVEFYIILIIEKGNSKHTIDFKEYPIQKGSVLTIRKDQIHQFHKSDSIAGTMLLFTDDFLVSYLEEVESLKSLQLFNEILGRPILNLKDEAYLKIVEQIQRLKKEYFEINDSYSLGIIRSELHILITHLFRIKAKYDALSEHRKYLNEFIAFQNLVETHAFETTKVKSYATMMGVSTKTLNTISRTIVHKSAKEFVDEICTKQIKRLLINTDQPIKEIAYDSGFEETTNFYKYFKRQTGLTPENFRNQH